MTEGLGIKERLFRNLLSIAVFLIDMKVDRG